VEDITLYDKIMKYAAEIERDMPSPLTKEKSMIVTMSASQRRMLARFGAVVGIDATYRVTMWGLPFFVLAVVNAQGEGFPAAFFWISEEASERARPLRKWCFSYGRRFRPGSHN